MPNSFDDLLLLYKNSINKLIEQNSVLEKRIKILEERLDKVSIKHIGKDVVVIDLEKCSFDDIIKIFKKVGIFNERV